MGSIYETSVDPLRPNDAHGIALQLVGRNREVLELGSASGHVTSALKQLGNTVTAVERDARFAEVLRGIADFVVITDLDWLDLRQQCGDRRYDVVLAGDILEHCSRPDLILNQCHDLLEPGGCVVVSIPNIAHADVRLALLTGKFEYRTVGLLDQTHLRFFTRETIEKFVVESGFEIAEIFASTAPLGTTEIGAPHPSIPAAAIEYVKSDRDACVYQYVLRLVPVGLRSRIAVPETIGPNIEKLLAELSQSWEVIHALRSEIGSPSDRRRLIEAESELSELRHQLETSNTTLEAYNSELSSVQTMLEETIGVVREKDRKLEAVATENRDLTYRLMQSRDQIIGASAELGVLRSHSDQLQKQVDSMVHQLEIIHTSRTWRIGRFVILPLRALRWLIYKITR